MSSPTPQPQPAKPTPGQFLRTLASRVAGLTVAAIVRFAVKAALVLTALIVIAFCVFTLRPSTVVAEPPASQVVYLDAQGWGANLSSSARQTFYYTAQGANLKHLRYAWFVHLERAWSSERLAAPENMRRYRFLVDSTPTAQNPDQLPVGFARFFDASVSEDLLDITCAACHTGELHVNSAGKRIAIRIDGGQALHAFTSPAPGQFLSDLSNSLLATYLNPLKFRRFAKKVLGSGYPQGYFRLHSELGKVLWAVLSQGLGEQMRHLYPSEEGFGRTDAVQRISNNVFGDHIDAKNLHVGNAPVSYPPVWNIWKFDWVQYGAEARQPLARNLGESLGTGADYKLVQDDGNPLPVENRFATSTAVQNLIVLEDSLKRLNPPKWPEEILGAVDCDRVRKGKQYFQVFCVRCHGPNTMAGLEKEFKWWMAPLKTADDPLWAIPVVPLATIGTDPNAATNFNNYRYDLTKTGMTADEIRTGLLPDLAVDEERRIEFLQAKVRNARAAKNIDCQAANELASAKAALAAADAAADGPSPCMDALRKLDEVPSPAAQCKAGPLAALNGYACSEAVRAYSQAVLEVAKAASQVCPNIRRALDSVDVQAASGGAGLNYVGMFMRQKYFRDNGILSGAQSQMAGFGTLDLPQVVLGYKPRPLGGIWATPPYLHNGSVPTLYELLSPASRRSQRFIVGDHSFDVKNVGLATQSQNLKGMWFDTHVPGNSNSGHEFRNGWAEPCTMDQAGNAHVQYQKGIIGPELTDEIRFDLIEYLKIKDDDAPDSELPPRCRTSDAPKRSL